MKKYYMCGTGEELKFGDMVELDLVDKKGDSKVHHHIECKFMDDQECIDMLLDLGAIEEKEVEDKELIDFSDDNDTCPCGYGDLLDKLNSEVDQLKESFKILDERIREIQVRMYKELAEMKIASSKKKK